MRTSLFFFVVMALIFSGCSAGGSGGSGSGGDTPSFTDDDLAMQNQGRYGDGNIPNAQENGPFADVHFEFNSATVRQEDYEIIQSGARALQEDPTLKVEIEGHCDKRGTNEYNLALGEERAKSVAKLMVSFGASAAQLSTISYGEEIPLDPGNSEDAFTKNRRAHFVVFRK